MGSCNTTQNEVGGKELLLKACQTVEIATTDESTDIDLEAHGLKVGDIVSFNDIGTLTVVALNTFYFVVGVTDDTFEISATRGGTAIEMDATEAELEVNAFKTLGGLRSKTFAFNSETIEITSLDSDEWKKLLDGAGIRSFSVSGSGVYTNEQVFQYVFSQARANNLTCLMFIDVKASRIFEGCFKITSLEVSGEYNAEASYSISAESSGQINIQEA